MTIDIIPATREHADILARLWPLYQYDMSEVGASPINAYGLFEEDTLRTHDYRTDFETWWCSPEKYLVFLIRVDGRAAGFALVTVLTDTHAISEFFVLRGFRRQGVARSVAKDLFCRFPGPWELSVYVENASALAFWRSILGEVAVDGVTEETESFEWGAMIVFRFSNGG